VIYKWWGNHCLDLGSARRQYVQLYQPRDVTSLTAAIFKECGEIFFLTDEDVSVVTYCNDSKRSVSNVLKQGVPGGKDLTSGECSLGQTIPI
jgi:hypothetical protein